MPASGTYPALQVSVAWGIAASAVPASGDWVDESAYVKRLSIKWGREDEFSQPGAGTLSLTFDNSTGRFDPDNTTGPRYGQLRPLTWVRVRGGTTTANTDVFYGQVSIEGWRLSASQFPGDVDVEVSVLDGLEQLANTDLPGSVWELEVRADSPTAWYRLGESSGTRAVDSSGNGHHGTYEGGATFNSRSSLVEGDSNAAIEFAATQRVDIPSGALPSAYPFSFEAWVELPANSPSSTDARYLFRFAVNETSATTDDDRIYGLVAADSDVGNEGKIEFGVANDVGNRYRVLTSSAVDDGQVHHVVFTASAWNNLRIYVDGVDVTVLRDTLGTVTVPPFPQPPTTAIGNRNEGDRDLPLLGTLDEFVVYNSALSAARVTAHYNAGTAPWANDLTSARVTKVLDAIGWPSTLRSIETGQTTMPQADLGGADALSTLQAVALAEGGRVFVDHQDGGKFRFEDRHERLTLARSTTSQATFGDGGGAEVPYDAIELQDDRIINSVTLARFGGSAITVVDATSRTNNNERDYSESGLLTTSDTEVASRAAAIVAEKKDRYRRVRSMTLRPRGTSHPAWAQVFARRLSDRVTVKWRPPYGGTYTYYAWVEAIAHEWVQKDAEWSTTLWLSPVPYGTSGHPYFIWDTSTWDSGSSPTRWAY